MLSSNLGIQLLSYPYQKLKSLIDEVSYKALMLADSNLHISLKTDSAVRYRGRMLLLLTYFYMLLFFGLILAVLLAPLASETKLIVFCLWLYQFFAYALAVYLLQVKGFYKVAAHLILITMSSLCFTGIAITGGPVLSPVTEITFTLPIIIFFLLGMRGGVLWITSVIIILIGFFVLARLDYPFPNLIPDDLRTNISVIIFATGFLIIFFLILIYENTFLGLQSQQQKSESQTRHLATHDKLTGIANRTLFYDTLEVSIEEHQRLATGKKLAFIYMDLVGFKEVNDQYGHHTGDIVLQKVAHTLDEAIRGTDIVARHGGDEFVFLLNGVKNEEVVHGIANKIAALVSTPVDILGDSLQVFPSMGIALFPDHAQDTINLERVADEAMYMAKSKKCDWQIYQGKDSLQASEAMLAE
jgi:diguanylate cyclase (GGDEF)-like protein